ncbi:MAG TPA: hypothetical protein VMS09_03855 [Paenibacillus sp.]|uniref:hypothetical protein n=1 Tax=Paenibacillus sp. TaxID=58172 RepID=UPI002C8C13E6|nr:hypothetical protein [Paenibacillus sp.]HUC91149.1 hypothetical protein [Paenibacillus sp.]
MDELFNEYSSFLDTEIILNVPTGGDSNTYIPVKLNDNSVQEKTDVKKVYLESGKYDIIGLSLSEKHKLRLYAQNLSVRNIDGVKTDPTTRHYLQAILRHEAKSLKLEKEESKKLFDLNNVSAASTVVSSNSADMVATGIDWLYETGDITAQWQLLKSTDETDPTFDYFTLKDMALIQNYNGYVAEVYDSTHTLPFSSDNMFDADPGDSSGRNFSVSIGVPMSISYSYSISAEPVFDLTTSWSTDTNSWHITDSNLASGDSYQLLSSWKSTGTYAGINVNHYVYWDKPWTIDAEGSVTQSYQVRYDY